MRKTLILCAPGSREQHTPYRNSHPPLAGRAGGAGSMGCLHLPAPFESAVLNPLARGWHLSSQYLPTPQSQDAVGFYTQSSDTPILGPPPQTPRLPHTLFSTIFIIGCFQSFVNFFIIRKKNLFVSILTSLGIY